MQSPVGNIPYSTIDLTILRQHLLDLLCKLAYKEGDFVLSSGQKSTYYINGKLVTLHPEGAVATARIFRSMLPADTDAVAGGKCPPLLIPVGSFENRSILWCPNSQMDSFTTQGAGKPNQPECAATA